MIGSVTGGKEFSTKSAASDVPLLAGKVVKHMADVYLCGTSGRGRHLHLRLDLRQDTVVTGRVGKVSLPGGHYRCGVFLNTEEERSFERMRSFVLLTEGSIGNTTEMSDVGL